LNFGAYHIPKKNRNTKNGKKTIHFMQDQKQLLIFRPAIFPAWGKWYRSGPVYQFPRIGKMIYTLCGGEVFKKSAGGTESIFGLSPSSWIRLSRFSSTSAQLVEVDENPVIQGGRLHSAENCAQ